MTDTGEPSATRREFLTGRALRNAAEGAVPGVAAEQAEEFSEEQIPRAGPTLRIETRAMACTFSVVMNAVPAEQLAAASQSLDLVHALEAQMTVYRTDSELAQLNRRAAVEPVPVEAELFRLLLLARDISRETSGAFDPTSGPLIAIWRRARQEGRLPGAEEIEAALALTGMSHVLFDEATRTIAFDRAGVELNLGAIGKGHAVDRAADVLKRSGLDEWLVHGGFSSVLARGGHFGHDGWPVGIRNPLIPGERLATILLKDRSLSTSGSNVQYFRHQGKRYGHILDPRTGWPAEQLLSVSVVAPTAALADALSTAFFVGGVEKSLAYCDNHPEVGALFVLLPGRGRSLEVLLCGIAKGTLFFEAEVHAEVCRA